MLNAHTLAVADAPCVTCNWDEVVWGAEGEHQGCFNAVLLTCQQRLGPSLIGEGGGRGL